jgi:hypothetical protein
MKSSRFILLSLLIMLVTSCDPPHNIVIVNNTKSVVKFKIQIDTTVTYNQFMNFDELKSDSLVYKIKPEETYTIYFGIGTWSNDEIKYLTNSIKKLEIENQEFHYIYKTKNKIEKLLIENREDKIGWDTKIIFDIK